MAPCTAQAGTKLLHCSCDHSGLASLVLKVFKIQPIIFLVDATVPLLCSSKASSITTPRSMKHFSHVIISPFSVLCSMIGDFVVASEAKMKFSSVKIMQPSEANGKM